MLQTPPYHHIPPISQISYTSVYELSRLRTLFLDSFILLLDLKPLHVSAVFCFSHYQNLCNKIFNFITTWWWLTQKTAETCSGLRSKRRIKLSKNSVLRRLNSYTDIYKVVQIWPGLFVCKQVTVCPGHIWTTLYLIKHTGKMERVKVMYHRFQFWHFSNGACEDSVLLRQSTATNGNRSWCFKAT
jgi:hypothetical protein